MIVKFRQEAKEEAAEYHIYGHLRKYLGNCDHCNYHQPSYDNGIIGKIGIGFRLPSPKSKGFLCRAHQAEEVSDALENSLSMLKEHKSAKEFRQIMQMDAADERGQKEIEKVNLAMSQVEYWPKAKVECDAWSTLTE